MDIVTLLTINGFSIITTIGATISTVLATKLTRIIDLYDTEPTPSSDTANGNGSSSNPPDPADDPQSSSGPSFNP